MWDRYDPRSDDGRDRGDSWDRSFGSRGSASERDHNEHSRDAVTRDLDLPRRRDREQVRERDRVYEIDGAESRTLATIGAFRVVAESDLHDLREDAQRSRRSLTHLETEGLIRRSPLSSDDRAVVLTERGRDFLEANRYERPSAAFRSSRSAIYSVTRRSSRPSATTISDWRRCRQPLNGWKEARRSTRRSMPRTKFQESFKIPPNRASLAAKTPPRNPLQVTDSLRDGELVPVRGFEPRSRG